jgi:hypothetical protein
MRLNLRHKLIACSIFAAFCWTGSARAYDSGVYSNLNRSRDALLGQRQHLQEVADSLTQRINDLQRQLDGVNSYLRDTDNAIRDVDSALKRY